MVTTQNILATLQKRGIVTKSETWRVGSETSSLPAINGIPASNFSPRDYFNALLRAGYQVELVHGSIALTNERQTKLGDCN